jgi:glutamate-5-semialdehyde dehydrogenase
MVGLAVGSYKISFGFVNISLAGRVAERETFLGFLFGSAGLEIRESILETACRARAAASALGRVPSDRKDRTLLAMAGALREREAFLLEANAGDVAKARERGLSAAMVDRLTLTPATIQGMGRGLEEVAALPDPVGRITCMWRRPNGLLVGRMRIPLGVIGIIYEARPNVTV